MAGGCVSSDVEPKFVALAEAAAASFFFQCRKMVTLLEIRNIHDVSYRRNEPPYNHLLTIYQLTLCSDNVHQYVHQIKNYDLYRQHKNKSNSTAGAVQVEANLLKQHSEYLQF